MPAVASSPLTFGPTTSVRSNSTPGSISASLARIGLNGLRLRFLAAGLALDADQHVVGAAELLQRHLAEPKALQARSQLGEIGRLRGRDLHLDAALEVDAVVEARLDEQHDRGEREERRHADAEIAPAHEGDRGPLRESFNRNSGSMRSVFSSPAPHDRRS